MLPEWMDGKFTEMLPTVILGCGIGTLWRAVIAPRESVLAMAKGAFVSITVGAIIGGAVVQYLKLDGYVASSIIATVAYLGEHTLAFFEKRGEKLRQGKIDTSIKGDEP